jgi:5-bromo-4-chloroindolyl phosphate hydrolysis protein
VNGFLLGVTKDRDALAFPSQCLGNLLLVLILNGIVGIVNLSPSKFFEQRRQLVSQLMSIHWLQKIGMEDVLTDMGLKDDKYRTICNCLEKMRNRQVVLQQTQSEAVNEDERVR